MGYRVMAPMASSPSGAALCCRHTVPKLTPDVHKISAFGNSFGNFVQAKDFPKSPEVDLNAVETQLEVVSWLMMPSRMALSF